MGSIQHSSSLETVLSKLSLSSTSIKELLSQDASARSNVLKSLRALTASLETPEDVVTNLVYAPSTYMCARVAIDLKIFNLVASADGHISAVELAAITGAEELLVVRLMRGLTVAGMVSEAGDQVYKANPVTHHLTKAPVQAGLIHFYDAGLKSLQSMPEYFKENGYKCPADGASGPLQYAFNTPLVAYEYWRLEKPDFFENFNIFMAGKLTAGKTGQFWNDFYPIKELIAGFDASKGDAFFVDIAGGIGHEAALLKFNFPEASGKFILQEVPAVLEDIKDLDPAIECMPYNFFTPQPVIGARTYFMANIMHNWTNQECHKILSNTVPAMTKGYSKILFSDHIVPEQNAPLHTVGRDIGMMSLHSGVERSEKMWTVLLEKAGLKIVKFYALGGHGEGLVEAERVD